MWPVLTSSPPYPEAVPWSPTNTSLLDQVGPPVGGGGDPEGVRCVLINNSGGVLFPLFLYPGQYWRLFTRNNIDANHSNISAAYKPGGTGKHSFIYNFKGRWI